MFANYTKIAFRVMARSKVYAAINISGLALGSAAALLLFLWVHFEFSFEQFHPNKDRLFIAWNRAVENGQVSCWSTTPRILAPTLEKEFPDVEHAVSYAQWGSTQRFKVGDKNLLRTTGIYTDPAFLQMLDFPLIKGDPKTVMQEPASIVLTEDFAYELFGNKEPLGETVTVSEDVYSFDLTVTGVLKKLPRNTTFQFEYIIPFSFPESAGAVDYFWGNNSVTTVVLAKEGADVERLNEAIRDIEKKHYKDGQHIEIFLHPLLKHRLYSSFENGVEAGGRIDQVKVVIILAVCLVLIGCINFINLSTARAQKRAKEISVRKVTGAVRWSLIFQFVTESVILCAIAALLSVGIAYLILPQFGLALHEQFSFQQIPLSFWGYFAAAVLAVGVIAGFYPAFYLSSLGSVRILTAHSRGKANRLLRSGLVVVQFGIAILLIVGSTVVYRQSHFLRTMDPGYDIERLVYMPITGDLIKNFTAFKTDLLSQDVAQSVTRMSAPFTEQWSGTTEMQWAGKNPEERVDIQRVFIDEEITETASLTLIAGRDLDLDKFPSDSNSVLINETTWRLTNFENPIGETITDSGRDWKIVGVVKDFVFETPFMKKAPVVLFGCRLSGALTSIYIRLDNEKPILEIIDRLETLHRKYNPDYPFEFHFADAAYAQKFETLESTKTMSAAATALAIFIACIGLLGLATYMIEVRRKEIGIRKVLGGSVYSIIRLLSFTSLKPITVSVLVFAPLSWIVMETWLSSFPYRTDLELSILFLAVVLLLLIAFLTVTLQTAKAALDNPVNSLRSE